ncbi:MAG: hypothetical protein J6T65_10505 [Clostridia bacterium]|nr:hypothetical protein [Clostridia bacterium]MBO7659720.1 hypothetical protein [Clostridia bacterium]MBP5666449.1 hypothetical protein [Clostridia bacterium]MBP5767229.1 hypothetical protein [Clostridia bacterium]MBR5005537.1 hypothetical protein [Clostridia bacterium]
MNDMLSGIYENSIDSKSRVVVPQDLRSQIAGEGQIYITYGPDHCVRLYSCEAYANLYASIEEARAKGVDTRPVQALFVRPARKISFDGNGRILLPSDMRRWAFIGDDVKETCVVGNIDHVEIWSMEEFDRRTNSFTEDEVSNSLLAIGNLC